jgi:hypothetical protein
MSIYFDTVMNSMILKSMEMSHYINYAISIQWYSDIRKKWGSIKQNKVHKSVGGWLNIYIYICLIHNVHLEGCARKSHTDCLCEEKGWWGDRDESETFQCRKMNTNFKDRE